MQRKNTRIISISCYLFSLFAYLFVVYMHPIIQAKNEAQIRSLCESMGLNYTPPPYIQFDHIYLTILCLMFLVWIVYNLFRRSKIIDTLFSVLIILWVGIMAYNYYSFMRQSSNLTIAFIFLYSVFLFVGFSTLKKVFINNN